MEIITESAMKSGQSLSCEIESNEIFCRLFPERWNCTSNTIKRTHFSINVSQFLFWSEGTICRTKDVGMHKCNSYVSLVFTIQIYVGRQYFAISLHEMNDSIFSIDFIVRRYESRSNKISYQTLSIRTFTSLPCIRPYRKNV